MALLGKRALAAGAVAAMALVDAPARSADPAPASSPASRPTRRILSPIGTPYVDVLGKHASGLLATKGKIGALVSLPRGARATDFGLTEVAPGIGRLRGDAKQLHAFEALHPELRMEIAPPLHLLNDRVGLWTRATQARNTMGVDGRGVLVGVADTGLDVTHPDFLNEDGSTRVAWLLDLSQAPGPGHVELQKKFGIKDTQTGEITTGRVFNSLDINLLLDAIRNKACDEKTGVICAPTDDVGHGTHVMGIAAASANSVYSGVAPKADLIAVRVTAGDAIREDLLVTGVQFMFDRADFMKKPLVANLSLGSDFGPHDGSFLWEQALASYVGPDHPGHAIVAAAGNSGSIAEMPIHQTVYVSESTPMLVPIRTRGADSNGQVQVWITLRKGANLKIGLDGPDGTWISPVERGQQNGKNTDDYNAGIIYGSELPGSSIPQGSNGAVVIWAGRWPAGNYNIRLEGKGVAELYLEGLGEVSLGSSKPAVFTSAVREGTINLPATHPSIIGVGCTVNRPSWISATGSKVGLRVPVLDKEGGLPIRRAITPQDEDLPTFREAALGEICNFSSAGPTAAGVPKPEIAAPGSMVVSAMSRDAQPGNPRAVFTTGSCPPNKDGIDDKKCLQIDANHGVAEGTSMSAPVVAGVIALLFQQDPTLTQDKLVGLLQAGAHRYRTSTVNDDRGGPGEVDVIGSLDALSQMKTPSLHLPALETSWVALSSDWVAADGSTPTTVIVELRTADGAHRGDLFDANRLRASVLVDGQPVSPPPALVRRAPGVWVYEYTPAPGLGGSKATFGATFDGAPIVAPKTVPIAPDRWTALYPSSAKGSGCSASGASHSSSSSSATWLVFGLLGLAVIRRRR